MASKNKKQIYLSEEGLVGVKIALVALGITLLLEAISRFVTQIAPGLEEVCNLALPVIYFLCAIIIFVLARKAGRL